MAISRKGLRRIVVDGREYHWRAASDSHYDRAPEVMIVEGGAGRGAYGDGPARTIRFSIPWQADRTQPGWWHDLRVIVTPAIVSRAVRVGARRPGSTVLTTAEVFEILDLDRPRAEDRLRDLEAALEGLPKTSAELVRALLAIGCHGDRGELVDDWFACHADALKRDELAKLLEVPAWNLDHGALVRSAFEFLVDCCKRVGIALELESEIDELDRRLATRTVVASAPWGIPETHSWWR